MRIIILTFLMTNFVYAAAPAPYRFELNHLKTKLSFVWNGKSILVKDRFVDLEIPYQECNKELLEDFFAVEQELWSDRPASQPDPVQVTRQNETFSATTRSRLGGHLISMKDKMRLLKLQSEQICAEKK